MMQFPVVPGHRRSIRLPGFDYRQAGVYFVTICAFERRSIFGQIRGETFDPSAIGRAVQSCWFGLQSRFAHVELDAFVLMPNHLHGLLVFHRAPGQQSDSAEAIQKPVRGSLPTVMRSFKAEASAEAKRLGIHPAHPVWQRGYYERVLRHGRELSAAQRYILENPARWHVDHDNPANR